MSTHTLAPTAEGHCGVSFCNRHSIRMRKLPARPAQMETWPSPANNSKVIQRSTEALCFRTTPGPSRLRVSRMIGRPRWPISVATSRLPTLQAELVAGDCEQSRVTCQQHRPRKSRWPCHPNVQTDEATEICQKADTVPAVEAGELVFASLDLWATEIESDDPSAPSLELSDSRRH